MGPSTADFVLVYQVNEEEEDDVETTRRNTFIRNCEDDYGLEFELEVRLGVGQCLRVGVCMSAHGAHCTTQSVHLL